MTLAPEAKARRGFDINQPRDRKGRWVETGAEVSNAITRATGTVSRILPGSGFVETRYEVQTHDGRTETWERSAVDVVRNPDGSAPSANAPGQRGQVAPQAAPAARSRVADGIAAVHGGSIAPAINEVYAAAPARQDAPAASRRPDVTAAIAAVYGEAPQIDRVAAAERMHGTDSPQHREAQRRFGDGGPTAPVVDTPAVSAPKPGAPAAPTTARGRGTRYVADLPDGTTATRTSPRPYTHAIVVQEQDGSWFAHRYTANANTDSGIRSVRAEFRRRIEAGTVTDVRAVPLRTEEPSGRRRPGTPPTSTPDVPTPGPDVTPSQARSARDAAEREAGARFDAADRFSEGDRVTYPDPANPQRTLTGTVERIRYTGAGSGTDETPGSNRTFVVPADAPPPDARLAIRNSEGHLDENVDPRGVNPEGAVAPTPAPPAPGDATPPARPTRRRATPRVAPVTEDDLHAASTDNGEDLVPADMPTADLIARSDALEAVLTRYEQGNGLRSSAYYRDAVNTWQALNAERATRTDAPIDPGGTGSLFEGDGSGIPNAPAPPTPAPAPSREDRAAALQRQQREHLGLDDRWKVAGSGLASTAVSQLQSGDVIYTRGDGSQANPVELPRVPSGTTLPQREKIPRTVARVEKDGRNHTVHFTDGTSTGTEGGSVALPEHGARTRVYAASRADREAAAAIDAPPPVRSVDEARAHLRERADARDAYVPTQGDYAGGAAATFDARDLRALADDPTLQVTPEGFLYHRRDDGKWRLYDADGTQAQPVGDGFDSEAQVQAYSRILRERGINSMRVAPGTSPDAKRQRVETVRAAMAEARQAGEASPPSTPTPEPAPSAPEGVQQQARRLIEATAAANATGKVGTPTGDALSSANVLAILDSADEVRLGRRNGQTTVEMRRGANGWTTVYVRQPAPVEDVPPGDPQPTARARDLNLGDRITYDTPFGAVTGTIEGIHTAGPQTVVTLRGDDDARTTRAFAPNADVTRLANVADTAPVQDTPAGELRQGMRIVVPDATGTYRPATVLARRREPGGTALVLDVQRDSGDHETLTVDPAEALPRLTDGGVTEPDVPPVVDDPQPEDGTKYARDLAAGDRIATYGDTITVLRARVRPDGTVAARVRLANGSEDDVPFGPDAVLTLADPPNGVAITDLPADAVAGRPVLYTYQRKAITALNLDDPATAQSPVVQQAAARVRARQALTEGHAAALGDALRAQAAAPGVRAPRQRSLQRQAAAFDATAAHLAGREAPTVPGRDTVEKTRVSNLTEGDVVAIRGAGAGAGVEVVKVTGVRTLMGGRLAEITVENPDGTSGKRLLPSAADTYLLPDLPEDRPAPPETPRAEHVTADRVAVGDTIRAAVLDPATYKNEDREARVTEIRRETDDEGHPVYRYRLDGVATRDGDPYWVTSGAARDGGPTVVRVARGTGSTGQDYDSLLPEETPEQVGAADVQIGDRVSVPGFTDTSVGVAVEVTHVTGPDGASGVRLSIRTDSGGTVGMTRFDGDRHGPLMRLAKGDEGTVQRLRAAAAERQRAATAGQIALSLRQYRQEALAGILTDLEMGAGTRGVEGSADFLHQARLGDDRSHPARVRYAQAIAQTLLPDDAAGREALAGRVNAAMAEMRAEELLHLSDSVFNGQFSGQTEGQVVTGVVRQWTESPPRRDLGRIARTLVDAVQSLPGQGGSDAAPSAPVLPEGGDLQARMAAYRAVLPNGEAFGRKQVARTTFKPSTLDDLEAGHVPATETTTVSVRDTSPDGGPGATAMAHHDVLMAAGRDLDGELARRMAAEDPRLGKDPAATVKALSDERDDLRKQQQEASAADREARNAAWGRYLAGTGYASMSDLITAKFAARERRRAAVNADPAVYAAAEAEATRLDVLHANGMDQVNAAAAATGDRATAIRARQEEVVAQYNDMRSRLARARREAAIKLLADVRSMGDTPLTWQNPNGKGALTDRSEVVRAIRVAEASYPREWLQRFREATGGRMSLKKVKRGYNRHGVEIALSEKAAHMEGAGNLDAVAVHELGHSMEKVVPGILAAENAFLWSRTATGEVGSRTQARPKRLADLNPGRSYSGEEIAREDEFREPYTGKDYGGTAYEVLTTGVEDLLGGADQYLDDGLRHWLLGTMALL